MSITFWKLFGFWGDIVPFPPPSAFFYVLRDVKNGKRYGPPILPELLLPRDCPIRHSKLVQDASGAFFIDRDPRYFRIILNYLRSSVIDLENNVSLDGRRNNYVTMFDGPFRFSKPPEFQKYFFKFFPIVLCLLLCLCALWRLAVIAESDFYGLSSLTKRLEERRSTMA